MVMIGSRPSETTIAIAIIVALVIYDVCMLIPDEVNVTTWVPIEPGRSEMTHTASVVGVAGRATRYG